MRYFPTFFLNLKIERFIKRIVHWQVPIPEDKGYMIHLKSMSGEIEVYLCSKELSMTPSPRKYAMGKLSEYYYRIQHYNRINKYCNLFVIENLRTLCNNVKNILYSLIFS